MDKNTKAQQLESSYRRCSYGSSGTRAWFHFFHLTGDGDLCYVVEDMKTGEVHRFLFASVPLQFIDKPVHE